ncbi:Fungal specific transcription factor domain-containing protein [Cladophialophora immunda]|nr:Fungal specific transcription factor domain-containing protein [Cladophialophora immunda]
MRVLALDGLILLAPVCFCDSGSPKCSNCILYKAVCSFSVDKRRFRGGEKSRSLAGSSHASSLTPANIEPSNARDQQATAGADTESAATDVSASKDGMSNADRHTGPDQSYWSQMAGAQPSSTQIEGVLNSGRSPETLTEPWFEDDLQCLSSMNEEEIPSLPGRSSELSTLQPGNMFTTLATANPGWLRGTSQSLSAQRFEGVQPCEDGPPRFYGPTSSLRFMQKTSIPWFQPVLQNSRLHCEKAIMQANLQWPGDSPFEGYLTSLFFTWYNPYMSAVDEDIYSRQKQDYNLGKETALYSPALENAILAVGASYASRRCANLPESLDPSDFFGRRSKAFLDLEMDSPTIATLQTLLILSTLEAAAGRDSRGWLYSGMAVHLVFDLGLHLDPSDEHFGASSRKQDGGLKFLYKRIFRAVCSSNMLWSISTGRPSSTKSLIQFVSAEQDQPSPSWQNSSIDNTVTHVSSASGQIGAEGVPVYLYHLSVEVSKVMEVLCVLGESLSTGNLLIPSSYSRLFVPKESPTIVKDITLSLHNWFSALPAALRIETSELETTSRSPYPSEVIELNLQYHEAVILFLRHFFLPARPTDGHSPQTIDDPTESDNARRSCIEAASCICRLLILYRRQYGLRYINVHAIHIALTAGQIHIQKGASYIRGSQTRSEGYRKSQEMLNLCIQALGEMAQTFPSCMRAMEMLTAFRQRWHKPSALSADID